MLYKTYDKQYLDFTFGKNSIGSTLEERALTSDYGFVRSIGMLYRTDDSYYSKNKKQYIPSFTKCTGFVMSAYEALIGFGIDVIDEVMDRGSSIIYNHGVDKYISDKRQELGLTQEQLSIFVDLPINIIKNIELPRIKNNYSVHDIIKVACYLGLDHNTIIFKNQKLLNYYNIRFRKSVFTLINEQTFKTIKIINSFKNNEYINHVKSFDATILCEFEDQYKLIIYNGFLFGIGKFIKLNKNKINLINLEVGKNLIYNYVCHNTHKYCFEYQLN